MDCGLRASLITTLYGLAAELSIIHYEYGLRSTSLLRSIFGGTSLRDIPKNGCEGDYRSRK